MRRMVVLICFMISSFLPMMSQENEDIKHIAELLAVEPEELEDEVVMEDETASEVDEMFGDTIFDENEMGLSDDLRSSIDEVEEEE